MTLDPAPVEVTNADPIPVTMSTTDAESEARIVAAQSLTSADILRTEDQRRISGIWERTQQIIALSVVESTLLVIVLLVAQKDANTPTALAILFGLANLVIGFYFGRTNHTRVGGVGSNDTR